MQERVLVIDDDRVVQDVVREGLEAEGFVVEAAVEGGRGLMLSASLAPAVIVLDVDLPDMPGEDVLDALRRRSAVPIIVLSARAGVEDRVRGLELGADDYMTKPFAAIELVARVQALLRRAPREAPKPDLLIFDGGRVEIDTTRREVRVDRALRSVTKTEFNLLVTLAENAGQVRTRAEIALVLRGAMFDGDDRVIDVHVRNLRRKIEDDPARPRRIATVPGRGYALGLQAA